MLIVTGGAGLIGSAVIWRLNQLGEDNIKIIRRGGSENIHCPNIFERFKNCNSTQIGRASCRERV